MSTFAVPRRAAAWVSHRIHGIDELPAVRYGDLLVRDESYHRHAGIRRYFWLLDLGVQLVYEPFGWTDEWYVDVVFVDEEARDDSFAYRIADAYVDLVIEGYGTDVSNARSRRAWRGLARRAGRCVQRN